MKKKILFSALSIFGLLGTTLALSSCDFSGKDDNVTLIPSSTEPAVTETPTEVEKQHTWSEATYQWSSNNKYVVARRTCTQCGFSENERVTTEEDVTKQATCIKDGEVTYIAEFENPAFEIQMKTVSIPAQHTEVIDPRVEPTYTSTGLTAGSHCSVCGEIITEQIVIPKLVYPYYTEYEWASDDSYVIAKQYAKSTQELVKTETKNVTQEITTNGNCTTKDIITLTADFDDADFETQTKNIEGNYRHTSYVSKEAKEATCLTDGNTEEISCSVCKKVLTASETLKAQGHLEVVVPAQEPVGYLAGHSEYKKCSKCKTLLTKPTMVVPFSSIIDATSDYEFSVNITNTYDISTERLQSLAEGYAKNVKFFLAENEFGDYDLYVKFPTGYNTSYNGEGYYENATLNEIVKTSADNDTSYGDSVVYENHSIISRNKMFKVTFSTDGITRGTPKEYGYEDRYDTSSYDRVFKIYSGCASSTSIAQYFENVQIDFTIEIVKSYDGPYDDSSTDYFDVSMKYSTINY